MHQPDLQVGQRFGQHRVGVGGGLQLQRFGFFDQRADPVHLAAFQRRRVHALDHFVAPVLVDRARDDRAAARRQLVDDRHFEVGVVGHRQRARDRRGRHHQLVRRLAVAALVAQGEALADAEAVLLVDDHQAQLRELHRVLDQRVGADHQLRLARFDQRGGGQLVLFLQAAGQPGDLDAERLHPRGDLAEVLVGQDFGRRHQRGLVAAVDRLRRGQRRDHGLAAADVALQQALHRVRLASGRRGFP